MIHPDAETVVSSVTIPDDPVDQAQVTREVNEWWERLSLRAKLAAYLMLTLPDSKDHD